MIKIKILIAAWLLLYAAGWTQSPVMVLYPAESEIHPTEKCTLYVNLDQISNLGAYEFAIIFDSSILTADTVWDAGFISESGRTPIVVGPDISQTNDQGRLVFGAATLGIKSGSIGSGTLAQIVFTAKKAGSSEISFESTLLTDIDANMIDFTVQHSTVTVNQGELGTGWTEQPSGTSNWLYDIEAISPTTAWISGSNIILQTLDGGISWQNITSGRDSLRYYNIEAIDQNTAIVSAVSETHSYIFRTTDRGNSWAPVYQHTGGFMDDITLFSPTHGLAISDDGVTYKILETIDGGASWSVKSSFPLGKEGEHAYRSACSWISPNIGWFGTNNNRIYHTTDGGITWSLKPVNPFMRIWALAFNEQGVGLAASTNRIIRTRTHGDTWQVVSTASNDNVNAISFVDDRVWICAGPVLYSSPDQGNTWTMETRGPQDINGFNLYLSDKELFGWCVGKNGMILHLNQLTTRAEILPGESTPDEMLIAQNYPNPFNPSTAIRFSLTEKARVNASIFNIHGQKITTLVDKIHSPGQHSMEWNAGNHVGGLYFCRIIIHPLSNSETRQIRTLKMLYVK